MKRVIWAVLFLSLLAFTFLAGKWYSPSASTRTNNSERQILYYVDPMNPSHTSDKPGIAPCGMKMEPVYADAVQGQSPAVGREAMPPGTVMITPEKQQLIGVRTAAVEKSPADYLLRTVGLVAPDEKRLYRLVAGVDGWIRETYNNDTWSFVKKDERLASFYTNQARSAQLAYIGLLGAGTGEDRFLSTGGRPGLTPSQQASVSIEYYMDALESIGMSQQQLKELATTKKITDRIYILAPASGFILARNVSPGQRFDKGEEWYRIADLSRVWVIADLFRNEAVQIRPGTAARVVLPHDKKEFKAVVRDVLPQIDPNSRTMKVRLEADNPGFALRPDAFVDVEFPVRIPATLAVPTDAVLDSGLRKTVFVDRGNGYFEPRRVETGVRLGDRVAITKGLMEGERIAVSGNFLIDSESRMKMAAAGMQAAMPASSSATRSKDPVCGMEVSVGQAMTAGRAIDFQGKTYYFCMDECKTSFQKEPQRYAQKKDIKPATLATAPRPDQKKGRSHGAPAHGTGPAAQPAPHDSTHTDEPSTDHSDSDHVMP